MKVVNDLLGYSKLKIVQDNKCFNFSLDSVLLPNFVTISKKVKNILDIGTGNAPIPLILSTITDANIYGIELQKEIYDLAIESLKINKLEDRINLINDNVKNIDKYFDKSFFDVILSNPPYFRLDEKSNINDEEIKTIARHEKELKLEELIEISSKYLKNNGKFAMVHRTDRLIEIITLLKKYILEPKKIRFIYPKEDRESNLVLIEAVKGGKMGLKVLNPLIVHNEDGNYSKEILDIFKRGDNLWN